MAITSYNVNNEKKLVKKHDHKSPYLVTDKIQLLSRLTAEKRVFQKKTLDYISSFPLAANIYKATSGEFKSLKRANNKKIKKSVLTLPNEPARAPQTCTASDMNDSEYYSQSNVNNPRIKKRTAIKNVRKPVNKNKEYLYYDRDARYCSQYDINLDRSSTDLVKNHRGDCRRNQNYTLQKGCKPNKNEKDDDTKPHNVWAVLRSLNRFPFHVSPPMSDESLPCAKKKAKKKRVNCKNARLLETCHTEEIAYSISYDVDNNSGSITQSSSFDRVTVIEKDDECGKIFKDIEVRLLKRQTSGNSNDSDNKDQSNSLAKTKKKGNIKALRAKPEANLELAKPKNNFSMKIHCDKESDSTSRNIAVRRDLEYLNHTATNNKNDDNSEYNFDYSKDSLLTYFDNSGSSKAELALNASNKSKEKHTHVGNPYASQRKTISKLNLGNTPESITSPRSSRQYEIKTRKSRLVTTMPSACMLPKLTLTEIKNRLASMRYPIVVLGKDQVSCSVEVPDYDHPQFNGLDKQIWPFMVKWDETNKLNQVGLARQTNHTNIIDRVNGKNNNFDFNSNARKTNKSYYDVFTNSKNKKYDENTRPSVLYPEITNQLRQCKNKKTVIELKEKMLNLLYEKISNGDIINDSYDINPIIPPNKNYLTVNEYIEHPVNRRPTEKLTEYIEYPVNRRPTEKLTEYIEHPVNRRPTEKLTEYIEYPVNRRPTEKLTEYIEHPVHRRPTEKLTEYIEHPVNRRAIEKFDDFIRSSDQSSITTPRHSARSRVKSPVKTQQKSRYNDMTRPWAKAKRTNDLIENVINKIKDGVYFNQEHMKPVCNMTEGVLDISLQTDNPNNLDLSPKVTILKKQSTTCSIPGFDNTLPGLEIKTLNVNQIVIKHCVRDIMMQFDLTVPTDANKTGISPKMSTPLVPVEVTENQTKIFKYKSSLINAMLPAELCSILPKLMKLMDPATKSLRPLCSGLISKTQLNLSTISELSCKVSNPCTPIFIEEPLQSSVSPIVNALPAVKKLLGGMFSSTHKILTEPREYNCSHLYSGLLDKPISNVYFLHDCTPIYRIKSPFVPKLPQPKETLIVSNQLNLNLPPILNREYTPCTALELYTTKNKRLAKPFKPYSFENIIITILNKTHILNLRPTMTWSTNKLIMLYDSMKNLNPCNTVVSDNEAMEKKVCITVYDMKMNYPNFKDKENNHVIILEDLTTKCNEHIEGSANYKSENKNKPSTSEFRATNNKNKRKGFYRLYRKCKSATNIYTPPVEKVVTTQLNKILNTDDFFEILGSKKLSAVFDGYSERKILSSVVEMKNWITDINPAQAMLLLLLTNKKDTPNLVRFRPILIQGIAVNRITRATELDMEIEVIEKENLHKFSEYEGIPLWPASVQDDNQLLEELYWIAKTTASDYQKPFDDSSERLLKSLLEKRKKRNPSYLRVMARYVGLGLLKAPAKK